MLTDAKVRAAKPREKSYKLTDANRLHLLVTSSGGKLWRWNYDYDGKQRTMAFGAYRFDHGGFRRSPDQDRTSEGMPNVPARADIKMTDVAPIVKSSESGRGVGELVNR